MVDGKVLLDRKLRLNLLQGLEISPEQRHVNLYSAFHGFEFFHEHTHFNAAPGQAVLDNAPNGSSSWV